MTAEEAKIPIRTLIALKRYEEHHVRPGDFLYSVLCNNLTLAILRADEENFKALREIINFCMEELPSKCWHSQEKVDRWIAYQVCPSCDGILTVIPCPECEPLAIARKQMGDYKL